MKTRRIIPTLITLSMLLCGFHAMLQAIHGNFFQAAQLIVLAAILDGLDGEVARLFRGVTTFGAKLDTYVDTVSFGVAPAMVAYLAVWQDYGFLGMVVVSAILFSAVLRFSMYEMKQSRVKHSTFRGLPIPVSAVWIAMIILFGDTNILLKTGFTAQGPLLVFMWVCAMVFVVLQVTRVRYMKPNKEMIGFSLAATVVLMIVTRQPVLTFCVATCVSMLAFGFLNPLYAHRFVEEEETDPEESILLG